MLEGKDRANYVIYFDSSKAFDVVPHNITTCKMELMDMRLVDRLAEG